MSVRTAVTDHACAVIARRAAIKQPRAVRACVASRCGPASVNGSCPLTSDKRTARAPRQARSGCVWWVGKRRGGGARARRRTVHAARLGGRQSCAVIRHHTEIKPPALSAPPARGTHALLNQSIGAFFSAPASSSSFRVRSSSVIYLFLCFFCSTSFCSCCCAVFFFVRGTAQSAERRQLRREHPAAAVVRTDPTPDIIATRRLLPPASRSAAAAASSSSSSSGRFLQSVVPMWRGWCTAALRADAAPHVHPCAVQQQRRRKPAGGTARQDQASSSTTRAGRKRQQSRAHTAQHTTVFNLVDIVMMKGKTPAIKCAKSSSDKKFERTLVALSRSRCGPLVCVARAETLHETKRSLFQESFFLRFVPSMSWQVSNARVATAKARERFDRFAARPRAHLSGAAERAPCALC